jgi:hypothetical protein
LPGFIERLNIESFDLDQRVTRASVISEAPVHASFREKVFLYREATVLMYGRSRNPYLSSHFGIMSASCSQNHPQRRPVPRGGKL